MGSTQQNGAATPKSSKPVRSKISVSKTCSKSLISKPRFLNSRATSAGQAQGTVIEARPEGGRGNVANILIQEGELKVGDFIVMGRAFGRVRDITDDRGNKLKKALPPMPVQISGINSLPDAGDKFYCLGSLKKAEKAAEQRREREREVLLAIP